MPFAPAPTFTGFTPNTDGPGYYFTRPDGNSFLAHGEEANRLAGVLARSQGPDLRTAGGYDPTAPFGSASSVPTASDVAPPIPGLENASSGMSEPAPAASVAPVTQAPAAPTVAARVAKAGQAFGTGMQNAQNLQAQIEQAGQMGDTIQSTVIPKPAAFTAASNPTPPPANQLPAMRGAPQASPTGEGQPGASPYTPLPIAPAGKPGYRPSSMKVETEGGIVDPVLAAQTAKDYSTLRDVTASTAKAQTAFNEDAAATTQSQAAANTLALQDTNKKIADNLAQQQQEAGEYQKTIRAATLAQEAQGHKGVDSGQLFHGKPGATIGAAIAIVLGGIGQGFSAAGGNKTSNAGLDAINRAIDQNIQNQRDELRRGGEAAANKIAALRDAHNLSTEQATHAYNILATNKVVQTAALQAATSGNAQARQNLPLIQQWAAERNADTDKKIQADIIGNRKTSTELKYNSGQVDPLAREKREDEHETFQLRHRLRIEHPDWTPKQIEDGLRQGGGNARNARAVASLDSQMSRFDSSAEGMGYTTDAKGLPVPSGDGSKADEGTGFFGSRGQAIERKFGGKSERAQEVDADHMATAAANAGLGDKDEIKDRILYARSEEERTRYIQGLKRDFVARKRAFDRANGNSSEPEPNESSDTEGVYQGEE